MAGRFKCDRCGKAFARTAWLTRHTSRKTPCAPILEPEDLPESVRDNPNRCRFCGRVYSSETNLQQHMKKACKIAPRDGDTTGMDKLYEHVVKKKLQQMEEEMRQMKESISQITAHATAVVPAVGDTKEVKKPTAPVSVTAKASLVQNNVLVGVNRGIVDQSTKNTFISINVFGNEDTSHITRRDIWGILQKLGPVGEDARRASELAILRTAMMIYSDEKHPENITCYLPNKKGKDALIHGESGWEVQPVSLALSPIAAKSVDELFNKQPYAGHDGLKDNENLDEVTRILRYIKANEGVLVNNASTSSELRAIPIRNKELLEKILAKLPISGDQ